MKDLVPGGSTQESRYLCRSAAQFVRRLNNLLAKGYHFHVSGILPEHKDPTLLDQKLGELYPLFLKPATKRQRSKRTGEAKLYYLRFRRSWVIVATPGNGIFWEREKANIRKHASGEDPEHRPRPILFWGYSISLRNGVFHARIRSREYERLRKFFLEVAARRDLPWWREKLWNLPFEPYAPVLRQIGGLVRRVNKARQTAGLEKIPESYIRVRRNLKG